MKKSSNFSGHALTSCGDQPCRRSSLLQSRLKTSGFSILTEFGWDSQAGFDARWSRAGGGDCGMGFASQE